MKKCRTIGALALITVFLGACPTISTNPLSDPKTAAVDDRLIGLWSVIEEADGEEADGMCIVCEKRQFMHFVRQEDGMTDVLVVESHEEDLPPIPDLKFNGGDGGGPEAEMVGEQHDPVGGLAKPLMFHGPGTWYAYRMFPSRIAGHAFMNLRLIAPEEGPEGLGGRISIDGGGYLLTRYEITEKDELNIWLLFPASLLKRRNVPDPMHVQEFYDKLRAEGRLLKVKGKSSWVSVSSTTILASKEEWGSYIQTFDPVLLFSLKYGTFHRIK